MIKSIICLLFIFSVKVVAQPVSTKFHLLEQKDSLYYLVTEDALYKLYSHKATGDFYLTNYIEKSFPNETKLSFNDEYLFLTYNDTLFVYSNTNPFEITLVGVFTPENPVSSIHGFGPFFFILSNYTYSLYKTENQSVVLVEDSLFTSPSDELVFFTYPYVIRGDIVYKYIENFDFYAVTELSIHFKTSAISENVITSYNFFDVPGYEFSELKKITVKEPDFPEIIYEDWGINIDELLCPCSAYLESSKNLLFINYQAEFWPDLITTYTPTIEFIPVFADKATITDYYVFLLGYDTLKYSRWYEGSTFNPVEWTDLTGIENYEKTITDYSLSPNYPNPFNPQTKIEFTIPEQQFISLTVYDALGNEIRKLLNEELTPGRYEINFNAEGLSSGVYFYQLRTKNFIKTNKMILLR